MTMKVGTGLVSTKEIAKKLEISEPAFREIYVPLINALVEQAKNDDQKIKGTAAPAAAQPSDEKPVEIDPKTGAPKA